MKNFVVPSWLFSHFFLKTFLPDSSRLSVCLYIQNMYLPPSPTEAAVVRVSSLQGCTSNISFTMWLAAASFMSVTLSPGSVAGETSLRENNIVLHCQHVFSLALQLSLERNINRQTVNNTKGSNVKRNSAISTYRYERSYAPVSPKAVGQTNTSRSEPDIARQQTMPKRSAPAQRVLTSKSTYRRERPTSQILISTSSQPQLQSPKLMNGNGLTRSSSQFVCSTVDGPQTFSKSPVPESAPKIKNDVRWERKSQFSLNHTPHMPHFLILNNVNRMFQWRNDCVLSAFSI